MEENKNVEKLSYEELEKIAGKLNAQNASMRAALAQVNRLEYLLKVMAIDHLFNEEFITKCAKEVEDIMFPTAEATETVTE